MPWPAPAEAARGGTAYVTLEPCNHTGRTQPCSTALYAAGLARVVYAQSDPNPHAAGGAAACAPHGVAVEGGLLADEARRSTGPGHTWSPPGAPG